MNCVQDPRLEERSLKSGAALPLCGAWDSLPRPSGLSSRGGRAEITVCRVGCGTVPAPSRCAEYFLCVYSKCSKAFLGLQFPHLSGKTVSPLLPAHGTQSSERQVSLTLLDSLIEQAWLLHAPEQRGTSLDRLVGKHGSVCFPGSQCQIQWHLAPSCHADIFNLQGLPMFPSRGCLIS